MLQYIWPVWCQDGTEIWERERLIHQLKLLSHKGEYSKFINNNKNSKRETVLRNLQDSETQKSDNN